MSRERIGWFLGWSCCFFTAAVVRGGEELKKQADLLVRPYIESGVVGGLAIGVWHKGQTHVWGYGQLDRGDPRVPGAHTVFEIGSVTKTFTGLLLADAVIRGEAQLDQAVDELLPADMKPNAVGDRPIQLIHLATHTSGLPRLPDNLEMTDPENPYATYTPELLAEFLRNWTPGRAPGAKMEYSNLGMGLLGYALGQKLGKSYEALLRERVLIPLKMTDTAIQLSQDQRARVAPPHGVDGGPTKNWDLPVLDGAGGIRSTVDDMLKYVAEIAKPTPGPLHDAIELAWQVRQEPLEAGDFALGLGWHVARDGQTRWHNGGTGGYHSMVLVHRGLGLGVVVLCNTASPEIDILGQDLVRMIAGEKVAPRSFEKAVSVAAEVLQRYVGRYELTPAFQLEITSQDGQLMVQATGQPRFQLFPRSETEWFLRVVEATVTFDVDDEGKATSLDLFQNGLHQKAKRVADQ